MSIASPPPLYKPDAEPSPALGHAAARARRVLPWISLAVIVGLLYAPAVSYDFVNWDDPWYVLHNPRITSWHPANLWAIFSEVAVKNYAPLTTLSYLVDHTVWGMRPAGFHLTNLLLHAVNAVLVAILVGQLTRNRMLGWITAALFAVHPVQIESVAWVSSRKGLLSATFTLASLIYWLKPARTPRDESRGQWLFVAALLSKALAIMIPPVVIAYDVLVQHRRLGESVSRQLIPIFLSVCLLSVTMTAQNTEMGGVRGHLGLSKPHILAIDAIIGWKYVGMLAMPRDLCVLYDPPTSGIAIAATLAILAWTAVGIVLCRLRRRKPLFAFAAIWFVAFLLPVLNLFPITTLMNDRYLYLPSIAVFAVGAGLAQFAVARVLSSGLMQSGIAACALLAYAWATHVHLPVWKDDMSLWRHAMQHVPQLSVVRIQYATALGRSGDRAGAIETLERALAETNPDEGDRERIVRKIGEWQAASSASPARSNGS